MRTHPIQEERESMQEIETLLRTTLREYAPQTVDLEQGWATVAEQMASLDGKSQPSADLQLAAPGKPRQTQGRKRWPVMAAVAVLVVALLGAGVASPFSRWFAGGGSSVAYAYSVVNQSWQSSGIEITVGKAYADPERLYIAYYIQLSSDLPKRYGVAFMVDAKALGRYGPEIQVQKAPFGLCQLAWTAIKPFYCINKQGPTPGLFQVPDNVDKVVITWDITEVELRSMPWTTQKSSLLLVHGHWHFQFSIPFYHQEHDPGMPFPYSG